MTNITRAAYQAELPPEASPGVDWASLAQLARLVRVDAASGVITVRTGDASISLHPNGTVRIDARRIVHCADEDIVLSAARIDLN